MFEIFRILLVAIAALALAAVAQFSPLLKPAEISIDAPLRPSVSEEQGLPATTTSEIASSTEKKLPVATETVPPKTTEPAKPKPSAPLVEKPKTEPAKPAVAATSTSAPSIAIPSPSPSLPLSLNDRVRGVTINLICTTKAGGPLNAISASGVLIDSRGIVLTNSHVGQYLLLKDYPSPGFVECIVRTGSPAAPKYTTELLYLPPAWIEENAEKITLARPTGNGKHDYALLRITGPVSASISMPITFPHIPISIGEPDEDQKALVAGYPAGFLGGITIAKELYAASAFSTIGDVYTFGTNTLDLFSLGGTILAQQGSSGGPVTDESGNLIGIVVTASDAPDTASRDLRAITTSYILRDFEAESGTTLPAFLAKDVAVEAKAYQGNVAPALTQKLINAIKSP